MNVSKLAALLKSGCDAIPASGRLQLFWRRGRVIDADGFTAGLAAEGVAPVQLAGAIGELARLQCPAAIEPAVERHEGAAVKRLEGGRRCRNSVSCHSP